MWQEFISLKGMIRKQNYHDFNQKLTLLGHLMWFINFHTHGEKPSGSYMDPSL